MRFNLLISEDNRLWINTSAIDYFKYFTWEKYSAGLAVEGCNGKNNASGKENTLGLYGMQNHSMTCRKKYSWFIHSTFLSITAYKGLESLQNYISTSSCINFCLQKNLALLKRGSWCRSNEITTFVDVFLNSASFINSFSDANSNRRVEKGASF